VEGPSPGPPVTYGFGIGHRGRLLPPLVPVFAPSFPFPSDNPGGFMLTNIVWLNGEVATVDTIEPAWLEPGSDVLVWADVESPDEADASVLSQVFHFHELAIEDALSESHHPKIESYDGYLYAILHGIDFRVAEHGFATHDTDFFLGSNYLVTVHPPAVRSIRDVRETLYRNPRVLQEGTPALLHRIVDAMIDHYRPEVDKLEDRIDALEKEVFDGTASDVVRRMLDLKRDITSLRRIVIPQRDAVGRLARREFPVIDHEVAYRFRDVYDQLVRMSDEALLFQDRITGLLEAHVSNVSNRLNEVMKVLTVIATIFMPLTVLTGAYGMNVGLPRFPGSDGVQFWWVLGIMLSASAAMLAWFRHRGWI
jgi:magnesium transporter